MSHHIDVIAKYVPPTAYNCKCNDVTTDKPLKTYDEWCNSRLRKALWATFIGQFAITVMATVAWTTLHFQMVLPTLNFTILSQRNGKGSLTGAYDVLCTTCKGSGKVKVPNIREMSFGEKRALVERRA
uniref:hypothetical protein n=1 Tax=Pluralibacter gergoviae TaxID=61647 RepID=UPI001F2C6DE4|nr:hypothetical protein [Pluralibacter gergoviae]